MPDNFSTIPARKGTAARLKAGQSVIVRNTHGEQVVDTWAFNADDLSEFMSMEHTRARLLKLIPAVGDALLTNHRRPILTLIEDTSGGIHDMLMAACDRYRYEQLGHVGHHDSCTDNLHDALHAIGLESPEVPSPLNLFMNVPVSADGALSFAAPPSKPGGSVTLRAEMDCVVVFSSCPQDMLPVNGVNCTPTDAHFSVV
ncbi:DUF1989 domain-containing protein [Flaviflagellibacter deserti]|uniref:DUF1989 domain-containing protein n=1 Tax=Flaviflagellibacter deserti TaxID=2267266 RepID=A0ABV9Z0W2_9HYPH